MSRTRIRCAHYKRRIRDHESDLVLRDLDNVPRERYYQTTCGGVAYAAAAQRPSAYVLTVRHVEPAVN
jgi:hypothetical protein